MAFLDLRRTNSRKIGGVCSAISRRFNVSPITVRAIFIVGTLPAFYLTITIYLILWIITPYEKMADEKPAFFSRQYLFNTKELPKSFVRLSYFSLYPILFWPFIAIGAVFMFDNPKNFLLTFLYFILILSYPVFILALMIAGFKIYPKHKLLATLLPLIPISCGFVLLYFVFDHAAQIG